MKDIFDHPTHPPNTARGDGPSAIIIFAVKVGQFPRRSGLFHPTHGSRTILYILISYVNVPMATAFASFHSTPVVSKPSFTDLVHALFRYSHTILGWGCDRHHYGVSGYVLITERHPWDCHLISFLVRTYGQQVAWNLRTHEQQTAWLTCGTFDVTSEVGKGERFGLYVANGLGNSSERVIS